MYRTPIAMLVILLASAPGTAPGIAPRDEPPLPAAGRWGPADTEQLLQALQSALADRRLRQHDLILLGALRDRTGERLPIDELRLTLLERLNLPLRGGRQVRLRGYGTVIISGAIELDVKLVDSSLLKTYTVNLKADRTLPPYRQLWSSTYTARRAVPLATSHVDSP